MEQRGSGLLRPSLTLLLRRSMQYLKGNDEIAFHREDSTRSAGNALDLLNAQAPFVDGPPETCVDDECCVIG